MSEINFSDLKKPFPSEDIEWRLQSCGETNNKIWGKCLAYITNRAIQQRLDDVVGPENWKNEYITGPNGGILCGLSIKCNGEWITKWDGAENTQVEAVKGGLSDSMKRSAVQWGMGRYLYRLDEGWAEVSDKGKFSGKTKDGKWFKWNPPKLPSWALPEGYKPKEEQSEQILSPAAEKERESEFDTVRDTVRGYMTQGFITEDQKKLINEALTKKDIVYLKKIIAWAESESKKAS